MVPRLFAKLMMVLAVACGVGSLILFAVFPVGSYAFVRIHWPLSGILLWDGLLCLAFFLQHSGMVRRGFRDRIAVIVPRQYHRAVYSIASGIVLTGVVILWQPSDAHVLVIAGPFRLAPYTGVLIAIAVFIWGAVVLQGVDLFGLAAIKAHLHGTTEAASEFVIRGPYRWVRHPWYAAAIVLIWSCVDFTADRLLFNVLWTAWICIGAKLEEKDLSAELGGVYDRYRQQVPMLIPWRGVYRPASAMKTLECRTTIHQGESRASLYSSKYSRQNHTNLLLSSYGHRNEATQQLAELYPPVQFIPIIFALVLVAAS